MNEFGIGIDLGGTLIKAACFDLASGELLQQDSTPTRDGEEQSGEPAFLAGIRSLVSRFETELGARSAVVGVSSPGFADREATSILSMPGRMHGLEGLAWPAALDRPAAVLNDAHAALMGEIWQGAAAGVQDVILLTLGTGVGGAIVSDGQLLRGHTGKGGHLGHVSLDYRAGPDICGIPGSLEDQIGNHNVSERTGGRFASTRALVQAVHAGDEEAIRVWGDSMRALGAAVASYVNVLDPQLVLIGGGISQAWDLIEPALAAWMDEFEWRPSGSRVAIKRAALGEWAGTYGAVYFAMKQTR